MEVSSNLLKPQIQIEKNIEIKQKLDNLLQQQYAVQAKFQWKGGQSNFCFGSQVAVRSSGKSS